MVYTVKAWHWLLLTVAGTLIFLAIQYVWNRKIGDGTSPAVAVIPPNLVSVPVDAIPTNVTLPEPSNIQLAPLALGTGMGFKKGF